MPDHKIYYYYEYLAAKQYYTDIQLNVLCDQADNNVFIKMHEWNDLNFHQLWNDLSESNKNYYREMAKKMVLDSQPKKEHT